jgi:hypothetical protein
VIYFYASRILRLYGNRAMARFKPGISMALSGIPGRRPAKAVSF